MGARNWALVFRAGIALMLLWAGVDRDYFDPQSTPSRIGWAVFALLALCELAVRCASGERSVWLGLVAALLCAGVPAPQLRPAGLLRILELLWQLPEAKVLLLGLVAAARAVLGCLLLYAAVLYTFAVALTAPGEDVLGESVAASMRVLWTSGGFGLCDGSSAVASSLEGPRQLLFLVHQLLSLGLLGVTMNVLCEVVSQVARAEPERHPHTVDEDEDE